ncbi:MAG: disulfide bond formation protein B [Xanthomonadales bacterium]|nr:disulfide bond formation protein B [Xanthomonadales bacterium]|tara:strand:+ start:2844 stop:3350 length:507 start_codon:yes stop_codon:yes gene_type:complete
MFSLSFRKLALAGFLACALAMAFALYLQYVEGQQPCPLCIFQRIAMIATGLVFLVAALHAPRARGRWVYAATAAATALVGVALAARHVWLQSLPPDQIPACGPSLDYLLQILPVTQVIQLVFNGDGSCAKITSTVFGVSLPLWTLIAFSGLAIYALAQPGLARIAESR